MRASRIMGLMSAIFFTFATVLRAHPGHGETEGWSFLHWIGEPEHFIPSLLALMLIAGMTIGLRRRVRAKENISA